MRGRHHTVRSPHHLVLRKPFAPGEAKTPWRKHPSRCSPKLPRFPDAPQAAPGTFVLQCRRQAEKSFWPAPASVLLQRKVLTPAPQMKGPPKLRPLTSSPREAVAKFQPSRVS